MKEVLIPFYIDTKEEDEVAFVAKNLIKGMFLTEDRDTQNKYTRKVFNGLPR